MGLDGMELVLGSFLRHPWISRILCLLTRLVAASGDYGIPAATFNEINTVVGSRDTRQDTAWIFQLKF